MARPANRAQRRALQRRGVEFMHTRTVDSAAVAAAVLAGAAVNDLVMYQVSKALADIESEGADILTHAVITIGRHPDHPDDFTIQAKSNARKTAPPAAATEGGKTDG